MTILPAMPLAETLETTRIHRVTGRTGARTVLVTTRPCRASPRTISDVGLISGGQVPMPGEGSRAPHGVLVLDELPEFRRHVSEVPHQPLEEGVTSRTYRTVAAISGKKPQGLPSADFGAQSAIPTSGGTGTSPLILCSRTLKIEQNGVLS